MQLNILIKYSGLIIIDGDENRTIDTVIDGDAYEAEDIPIDTDLIISDEYMEGSTEVECVDCGPSYTYYGKTELPFCNHSLMTVFGTIPDSIYWKEA